MKVVHPSAQVAEHTGAGPDRRAPKNFREAHRQGIGYPPRWPGAGLAIKLPIRSEDASPLAVQYISRIYAMFLASGCCSDFVFVGKVPHRSGKECRSPQASHLEASSVTVQLFLHCAILGGTFRTAGSPAFHCTTGVHWHPSIVMANLSATHTSPVAHGTLRVHQFTTWV